MRGRNQSEKMGGKGGDAPGTSESDVEMMGKSADEQTEESYITGGKHENRTG